MNVWNSLNNETINFFVLINVFLFVYKESVSHEFETNEIFFRNGIIINPSAAQELLKLTLNHNHENGTSKVEIFYKGKFILCNSNERHERHLKEIMIFICIQDWRKILHKLHCTSSNIIEINNESCVECKLENTTHHVIIKFNSKEGIKY